MVATLHIPKIEELMKHQKINEILKVSTDYIEDLIRIFYVGLEEKNGATFHFSQQYHVTE